MMIEVKMFVRLLLGMACMSATVASVAQNTSEIPNPPAIPTAEERVRAEQAASEFAARQEAAVLPHGDALDNAGEKIVVEGDTTVTEYIRAGQVYSLKIKSGQGPTQYLDTPDDGQLQPPNEELYDNVNLPMWRIGRW